MNALLEFLSMGGYAGYVWGAYGLAAVVMGANAIAPALHRRRLKREFARRARLTGKTA